MAVTAQTSGTQTTTVGTEHTYDVSVAGTFTFHVDLVNAAAGDVFELRLYQIILTGGTRRVAYVARFSGAQPTDDLIKISVPISNELTDTGSIRASMKQTFGTSRSVPYKILKYA
jgi:hypothetical protein